MQDNPPYELRAMYRAGHSEFWEVADKAGILAKLNLSLKYLEGTDDPREAEANLFSGAIDMICGNHITPYMWIAKGKPIVCIASPSNGVHDRVITREPATSLADFKAKGLRIADTNLVGDKGIANHERLNHIIDVLRAGYAEGEATWLEMGDGGQPGTGDALIDAVKTGKADVAFSRRLSAADLAASGLHALDLPYQPMVNGPTITTSYETLNKKPGIADRLIRAMVETIHYARMNPEQTQKYLDVQDTRPYTQNHGRVEAITRSPIKPYPSMEGIMNAFELSCMRYEDSRDASPAALWDMHYLRDLDMSGFIDELLQEEPESVREKYATPFAPVGGAHVFRHSATI
ncbi:MAG TPA: hypothetical protein VGK54_03185 [Chloroflexota bacterium]